MSTPGTPRDGWCSTSTQTRPSQARRWESPADTVRQGPLDRTEVGFLASPVLARRNGARTGPLDIIVAGEDRHVYAWQPERGVPGGKSLPGFPVLVADPDKVTAVDPTTNHLTFSSTHAGTNPGIDEDQGKLIDTPAVAFLNGPGKPPSIIVGSNEEYLVNTGDEGQINAATTTTASLGVLGKTGILSFANGRVYAIKASGCSGEPSSCATGGFHCESSKCTSTAIREGWPAKIGIIAAGLLPDVGEGINGSPIVAPVTCPEGGEGLKIGVTPDAGPLSTELPVARCLSRSLAPDLVAREPARGARRTPPGPRSSGTARGSAAAGARPPSNPDRDDRRSPGI